MFVRDQNIKEMSWIHHQTLFRSNQNVTLGVHSQLNFGLVNLNIVLTIFLIEADLSLVPLLALQSFVDFLYQALVCLCSMQEAAGTRLLHHFCPNKAGQLTKPIRAVHDGVAVPTLSVSQEEVTVCKGKSEEFLGRATVWPWLIEKQATLCGSLIAEQFEKKLWKTIS